MPQSTSAPYSPFLLLLPVPPLALQQFAKETYSLDQLPSSTLPSPHQLPFKLSHPQSTPSPYIPFLLPRPFPAPAFRQVANVLHHPKILQPPTSTSCRPSPVQFPRPNLLPSPTFCSCCHPPFQLPPSSITKYRYRPNLLHPLCSLPSVTPLSSSRPVAARQASPQPRSTLPLYNPFLLPPPLLAPALTQLSGHIYIPNLLQLIYIPFLPPPLLPALPPQPTSIH